MSRPTLAQIDTEAIRNNLRIVKTLCPQSRVMAVVKADAYGHGAVCVAKALTDADAFAVTSVDEAVPLRQAGISKPICLLSSFADPSDVELLVEYSLTPVIHSYSQLALLDHVELPGPIDVWIKIDSGMHRLGLPPDHLSAVVASLQANPAIATIRLMSHLANADDTGDDYSAVQLRAFHQASAAYEFDRSLANSAGLVAWPATRMDWVRPGIMLYGASPLLDQSAANIGLRPAMTLQSAVISVKDLKRGDVIGYGGCWSCPEDMTVGVVACGYGDGYPRHAVSGTPVLINGKRAPLVGRISMDLLSVDLRQREDVDVGASVVLWGGGLPVEEIAQWAGTNAYELLCAVTTRVPRIVRGGS